MSTRKLKNTLTTKRLNGPQGHFRFSKAALGLVLGLCLAPALSWAEEPGITDKTIRIGGTMALEGDYKVYGLPIVTGMEAALKGQTVQKRAIEYLAVNDMFEPEKTVVAVNGLIEKGIFAMVNSDGSVPAKAALPILAKNKIPAFGFLTGAGFTEPGDILNFRANYLQEMDAIISAAIGAGVKPAEVCGYFVNDTLGWSGAKGMRMSLAKHSGTANIVAKLDQALNESGGESANRNNIGPVGFYPRKTLNANVGYQSIKKWEKENNTSCRLVVTITGHEDEASTFMGYARYKGEPWVFSTYSVVAGDRTAVAMGKKGIKDKVIAVQILPPLDSSLPIVAEARKALGSNLNEISLESYMVGRLFVMIMQAIDGPLTRENFLKAARRQVYDIGGFKVDFTNDNQGSDYVELMALRNGHFVPATAQEVGLLFKQ